ncbi:MAG: hypothetical protein Q8K58_05290 [Acidimicrobiales bacterium]|nr:hypothetical protein [Acidimicrobiales bacterium]
MNVPAPWMQHLAPAPQPVPGRRSAPSREHLRVVTPEERIRSRISPAMGAVLTALVFAVLFAVAGAHTILVQGQVRLDGLDAQLSAEQARYQVLRKEVAEMESPERIVAAAEERGMVTPEDLVYLLPPTSDGAPQAPDLELTRPASDAWATVKPLLNAP